MFFKLKTFVWFPKFDKSEINNRAIRGCRELRQIGAQQILNLLSSLLNYT